MIVARQDRIPVWSLSYLFVVVIGLGFLFTFFDIFDINVSFIQTCTEIVPHCTPPTASTFLGVPILLNLVGYVVGTLIFSPMSDRFGRRNMMLVTMAITGLGSLFSAVTGTLGMFTLSRFITGVGIGADLAIVNTYINEVAPVNGRAKYTALIFILSTLGAFFGIWIGLWLTTPATPFPLGLPFAAAGPHFTSGWRIMYVIGALLALVAVLLRVELPESPRWLISRGRVEEADRVVRQMEAIASRRTTLPEPAAPIPLRAESRGTYGEILKNPLYLKRTVILLLVWLFGYITVYSLGAGYTVILAALRYPPPEAGLIAAIGTIGMVLSGIFAYAYGETRERKVWIPVSAVITIIGGLIVALGGTALLTAFIGSIVLFFGFNLWVPLSYAWSAENYPTRARTTGFALVDGVGHLGAGIAILFIAPAIPSLGVLGALLVVAGFLVVAAVIAQFGTATRERRLDELSP